MFFSAGSLRSFLGVFSPRHIFRGQTAEFCTAEWENTAKLLAELPHEACCLKDLGKSRLFWLQGLFRALCSAVCRALSLRDDLEDKYVTVAYRDLLIPSKFLLAVAPPEIRLTASCYSKSLHLPT